MNVFKSGIAVLAVATVAGAIDIGAATTGGEPEARTPVGVSSETLNRQHGLDEKRGLRKPSNATAPAWLRALSSRSEALNKQHKLGEYAPRK